MWQIEGSYYSDKAEKNGAPCETVGIKSKLKANKCSEKHCDVQKKWNKNQTKTVTRETGINMWREGI